jgi:3,4-dihydroxy 2-butanone 4-phosphate synthase/GTP cyclohydrolase II
MVTNNTDSNQTAFTVSIDAAPRLGVKTGISANDRARTIQIAINPATRPDDLTRPGHVFPLRAREGGVLKRAGHTEAAVDLARLSGLYPAGVICEIQNPDGSMARLPQLFDYAREHGLKLISIADLIGYRLRHDRFVHRETVCDFPGQFGTFQLHAYRNLLDGSEHLAIVKGDAAGFADRPVLVRMHSECLTGDALGSLRCDCRMQLQAALKMIENDGAGVVVYLRQEGRGIGLINKLKAYSLQDMGLDTVEANERLGFPADLRDYGMGAQMLNDLGVRKIRLITNNPRKIAGLKGYGLEVVERIPLLIEANDHNSNYLATKAEKLGHLLLQTYLVTIALDRGGSPVSPTEKYRQLEKLRRLGRLHQLSLQEETRPVANALFDNASAIVHLGVDAPGVVAGDWYRDPENPRWRSVAAILDTIAGWTEWERMEFLLSSGEDTMTGLQMKLDRLVLPGRELPSSLSGRVTTQVIYSFHLSHPSFPGEVDDAGDQFGKG